MPGPSVPGAHEPLAVGPVYGLAGKQSTIWHIVNPSGAGPAWCGKDPAFWYTRVRGEGAAMRVCPKCCREYVREMR